MSGRRSRLTRVRTRGQRGHTSQKTGIPEHWKRILLLKNLNVLRKREQSNAPSIVERSSRLRTKNNDSGGAVNCHKSRKECAAGGMGREEMESGRPGCFAELAKGQKPAQQLEGTWGGRVWVLPLA